MAKLKDKRKHVGGRCEKCKWLSICAGNFRVRAEAATGDLWGDDPACYLTDEEIALSETEDLVDVAEGEISAATGDPIGDEVA